MSEWLGMHNPEKHRPHDADTWTPLCLECGACSEDYPCHCCLVAEVERLRKVMREQFALYHAEASAHRTCDAELDMREVQIQAVRDVIRDKAISAEYGPDAELVDAVTAKDLLQALDGERDE